MKNLNVLWQALERLVDGAAAADLANAAAASLKPITTAMAAAAAAPQPGSQHVEQMLQRLLLPRIKAALGEPNLAVRQASHSTVCCSPFRSTQELRPLAQRLLLFKADN